MTKLEKLENARIEIRHQDYRLRCLIRDIKSKPLANTLRSLRDIQEKHQQLIDSLTDAQLKSLQDDPEHKSYRHYADSFAEKLAQLKKLIKEKASGEKGKEATEKTAATPKAQAANRDKQSARKIAISKPKKKKKKKAA